MTKRLIVLVGLAFTLSALVACAGQVGVSISISPTEVALVPGEAVVFTATVQGAADSGVIWSSSGGQLAPSAMKAVFTAPAELGEYTVTATSRADPGRWASAVVSVGQSDGGIASLMVRPGSMTFVGEGESAVLEVLAFDASGSPVSLAGRAVEWRIGDSSAIDLIADPDDPTRATVRASAALGSAVVSAAVGSGGEVLSNPVGISVASVLPDVELVQDASVSFPFVDLPPGVDPASFSTSDYEVIEGVAWVSGFSEEEIAALLVVEGRTLLYPVILSGEPPTVGEVLLGTGGSAVMGRVRSVVSRDGAHLVQLAQVGLADAFDDFVFSFDSAELEAQGVVSLASWLGVDQAAAIAASATSIAMSDCEVEGGLTLGGIDATIEQSLAPVLELDVDVRAAEYRFLVGVRGSLEGVLGIDVQGGISGTVSCDAGPRTSLTMPLPAGPLATLLSAGATFQPQYKLALEASLGRRYGISGRLGVESVLLAGFDVQGGRIVDLTDVSGDPIAEFDLIADSGGFEEMNFGITPGYYFEGEVGVQFGGWTLERVCAGARLIPRLGGWCDDAANALFVEALQGSFGVELRTVWDSPRRVLNQGDSESMMLAAAVSDVAIENDAFNQFLARVKIFAPVKLELVNAEIEGPTLFRVFGPATIDVTSPPISGPVAQGQIVEVAVDDVLRVVVTGERKLALYPPLPPLDAVLESGEVWIAAGNRVTTADVTVVGEDSLSIALQVTEALCSEAIGGLVPLRFLGYNPMLGLVPTAGYLGDIRLDCVAPALPITVSIAPTSVTLTPGDTQSFTATVTGATNTSVSWSATCGGIAGTGNTITYTAPSSPGSCAVTATSVADASKSASATVTVTGGEPTAGADLVVQDLDVTPTAAAAGANVTVAFRVENVGDAPAGSSTVRVRINDDPTNVTTGDALLAELGTTALAAGQSQAYTQTVLLPSGLVDGSHYVWVVADVFNQANQSNYQNDRSVVPIVIGGTTPPQVHSATIAAGGSHSLALRTDGTTLAWGGNVYGQLGDGAQSDRLTPVQVSGLIDVTSVAAGDLHSLALRSDGTVWAWGWNEHGQLGDGTTIDSIMPVQVSGLSDVTSIIAGGVHSLAVKADGTVWAWGWNEYGQLGDGSTTNRLTPVRVSGLNDVSSVAAGILHSLALRSDGTVWAWGGNSNGQLGDGTTSDRHTPVQVSGLASVIRIASGGIHSLVLNSDGNVWGWGANEFGGLGDGTTIDRPTPVQVSGLSSVTSIAVASGGHSLALRIDGTVWGWGANEFGQLGDGTTTNRLSPVWVSGLSDGISIAGAGNHSLALRTGGAVWAWGYNSNGQLGDGTTTGRLTAVRVSGF